MVTRVSSVVWLIALAAMASGQPRAQSDRPPSFRSAVDLVSVSAVVRDGRGRLVRDLTQEDFEILDSGERKPIIEFWFDEAASVSVAVLLDTSGSMRGSKMDAARSSADILLARLRADDESAVFTFDSELREVEPFTTKRERVRSVFGSLDPYGATSLYDAIAEKAHTTSTRRSKHHAVVVFSDGVDTHSTLTAPDVSAIASSIDVPVYLVAIVSPLDRPDAPTAAGRFAERVGHLRDLARWTGGDVYFVSAPAEASRVLSELLAELRHQYVLAFESASEAGWRLIDVDVGQRSVRTRSAYQVTAKN